MRSDRWVLRSCVFIGLCVATGSTLARSGARVLREIDEPGPRSPREAEALEPVLANLRAVRDAAGFHGAVALPHRFAGAPITGSDPAARQPSTHSFTYTFPDGTPLSYFSQSADEAISAAVWEGSPDGISSFSLSGSMWDGDSRSRSLMFSQSEALAGGGYVTEGVTLWDAAQQDPVTGELFPEGIAGAFESRWESGTWSYFSEEHHYRVSEAVTYNGQGWSSEDGATTWFEAWSRTDAPLGVSWECHSQGETLFEGGAIVHTESDYLDTCDQLDGGGATYVSWNHSTYRVDTTQGDVAYAYRGLVECGDGVGALRGFEVLYDDLSHTYQWTDSLTGEPVGGPSCSWDPWGQVSGI